MDKCGMCSPGLMGAGLVDDRASALRVLAGSPVLKVRRVLTGAREASDVLLRFSELTFESQARLKLFVCLRWHSGSPFGRLCPVIWDGGRVMNKGPRYNSGRESTPVTVTN